MKFEFHRFVNQLLIDLPFFDIPLPPDEKKWRFWAAKFLEQNNLYEPLPTRESYKGDKDWRKWWLFFQQSYGNIQTV